MQLLKLNKLKINLISLKKQRILLLLFFLQRGFPPLPILVINKKKALTEKYYREKY